MRLVLKRMGFQPDVVGNGLEAVQAARQQHYDVVLMDLQMPEMDGLEATKTLRSELAEAEQPWIVAVTADALKDRIQLCYEAGMDDCVTKPVRVQALAEALGRCREPQAVSSTA